MQLSLKNISYRLSLFFWGCLISTLSFFSLFLIEYCQETYVLNNDIAFFPMLKSLSYCMFVAIIEEYFFRYLFLRKWILDKTRSFDKRIVLLGLISSVIFGFLHFNLDKFPIMQINLVFSGISLFFATYMFRSISIAVGMHFSWNFIQGVIFSFEGSGSGLNSIFLLKDSNVNMPPEASNFMILTFFVEIVLVYIIYKKIIANRVLNIS